MRIDAEAGTMDALVDAAEWAYRSRRAVGFKRQPTWHGPWCRPDRGHAGSAEHGASALLVQLNEYVRTGAPVGDIGTNAARLDRLVRTRRELPRLKSWPMPISPACNTPSNITWRAYPCSRAARRTGGSPVSADEIRLTNRAAGRSHSASCKPRWGFPVRMLNDFGAVAWAYPPCKPMTW
ncbi:MAG: hypothetical protein U1F19_08550 [Lysobacterales bacterium]